MTHNRNPCAGTISRADAILYIEAYGYENATAREMIKGHVHAGQVDSDCVPDHVNSAIIYGFEEMDYMMMQGAAEFGFEYKSELGFKSE